jgi:hypothetical protein
VPEPRRRGHRARPPFGPGRRAVGGYRSSGASDAMKALTIQAVPGQPPGPVGVARVAARGNEPGPDMAYFPGIRSSMMLREMVTLRYELPMEDDNWTVTVALPAPKRPMPGGTATVHLVAFLVCPQLTDE